VARAVPSYLTTADIQSPSIRYTWDDWNIRAIEEPLDGELIKALETVSLRATLAYAIGSAEWLVYRFMPLLKDRAPWDFLEVAWAMMIDHHYSNYGTGTGWAEYADESDWAGPIKGPIHRALVVVESALQEVSWHAREGLGGYLTYVATAAAQVNKLTLHVLPDAAPYRRWSAQVVARLAALYPVVEGDELGDVVPPEGIDPSRPFDPRRSEELVNAYLRRLDPKSNPFLSPPEAMLQVVEGDEPFAGTPYVFSIEGDRAARHSHGSGDPHAGHQH
jgi:hypothetical protein